LVSLADSVGISKPKLVECVKSPATEDEIRYEAVGAERAGATSTPTFYIEGGLMPGAHPLPVFRQVFDSILAGKTSRPSQGN
jgi:predicted DsbA family dithiol-disulfide isomerase